jgi:YidC/Oxa1 family membrane protein insertase
MPLILLIPVITAALQFLQSKMMVPAKAVPVEATQQSKKKKDTKALAIPEKKEDSATEFAQAFQTQSLYIFPLMLGYLSFNFPIGLSLYWNTFTLFGILQQYQISGWGSLSSLFGKKTQ